MASKQISSTQLSAALDHIPAEIWGQVAQVLPASSLPSFVLSSRNFYKSANHYLYRTVYFYITTKRDRTGAKLAITRESYFGAHRDQSWLFSSQYSSQIIHLKTFLNTITTNLKLQSYITGASFGWDRTANANDILIAKRCMELLKPSLRFLHLDLPDFDTKFALTCNVTFLEIRYPHEKQISESMYEDGYDDDRYDVDLRDGLRENLYSIFCIPSLRHLSLKSARTWRSFNPPSPADELKAVTSPIISLSLPNTIPLSTDLKEVLTWPNTLKYFYHENVEGHRHFFRIQGMEQITSPKVLSRGFILNDKR